ncbi:MAG: TIR domain-containing protein [Anaerolineaceae bacterium]|nr:TIR domain-containing protein [Anaerolineaceae bacterium]
MARRVFFSFQYEQDLYRANVIKNAWIAPEREAAGFWDGELWEEAKRFGDDALRRNIDQGLENTSVTVVLIGAETAGRPWELYKIQKSQERGNGLLGIYLNEIRDQYGFTDVMGPNPFRRLYIQSSGALKWMSDIYPTYSWVKDNGPQNLAAWVEAAARAAGR